MTRRRLSSSPERRLVTALARITLDAANRRDVARLLVGALDWTAIVDQLARRELGPLLHHHLRDPAFAGHVPAVAREWLKRGYLLSWYKAERIQIELGRVLPALEAAGIETVVLKGAALAGPLYRDPALRPMGDVDLLVRPQMVAPAAACLADLGYRPGPEHEPRTSLDPGHRHAQPLIHDSGVIVEIHRNVQNRPFAVDLASWWPAVVTAELGGWRAHVLGAEHGALHLLLHHAFHLGGPITFGQRLRQLCDIRESITAAGEAFRWPLFIQELLRHGEGATAAVVGELLALDRAYGALPLPPALTALATRRAAILARLAELDLAVDAAEAIHALRGQLLLGVSPLGMARAALRRLAKRRAYATDAALGPRTLGRVGRRTAVRARGFVRLGGAVLSAAWQGRRR